LRWRFSRDRFSVKAVTVAASSSLKNAMTAARGVAMVLDGSDNNLGGRRSLSALGIRFRHKRRAGRGPGADHRRADQECAATFIMLFHAEFLPFDSVRAQITRLDGATCTATDKFLARSLHLRFQRKLQAGHNAEFLPLTGPAWSRPCR
jgi:hypothetical protein